MVNKDEIKDEDVVEAGEEVSADAAGEEALDESKYAFAMAPVVRIMKDELDKDKMIRSRVKEEMNLWLEKVCRNVTKQMNRSEYTMVEIDDFKTAIEPYEMIDDVEGERHRIVATLEKIKQDCDSLIRDVDRKFITPSYTKYREDPSYGAAGENSE
ncbi:MAG: hypothetical protein JW724_05165 [Candidatus Altiarchaeota archaeon]|nr:hypothetical protein [Candidatus Altiarchaeota archaeon]